MTALDLHCPDDVRRDLFRAATGPVPHAIDHIEVLPSRRALLVHCFADLPTGLGAEHVVIEGGVRITPVRVLSAHRTDLLPPAELDARDQAVVDATTPPAALRRMLAVRTDSSGDFSTYTLRLLPPSGGTDVFDPVLSSLGFSFKVDCESAFDCLTEDDCPPERRPAPRIDYLAKDFASFRRLMLDRLSETVPEWRERNPVDLGVALVEAIAYSTDQLSYQQDATATESYLGTARLRPSVRRHARLLDYHLHDGCNARAWLSVEVTGAASGTVIDKGTKVVPSGTLLASVPDALEHAAATGTTVFETMDAVTARERRNDIRFHTWGDERCCLPRGATSATLVEKSPPLGLAAGDVLILEEVRGAGGRLESADPTHRHAVRISEAPSATTDPLDGTTLLEVTWHEEDALPFALNVGGTVAAPLAVVRGNIVLANHGLGVSDDDVQVTQGHRFRPELERPNVTYEMPFEATARRQSASAATRLDLDAVLPSVRFTGEGDGWRPQRDLLGSDAFATDFVLETTEDGRAVARFGDGTYGRRPSEGEAYRAHYRIGNGPAGNVGADTLTQMLGVPAGVAVRNPLPAAGGTAPQPLTAARLHAPHAFRRQERAVTEADYAAAAERHEEVQKAAATRRWTGSWHTMFVTVDRLGGREVDSAFEQRLRAHLDRFRLAGYDLEIDGPQFVPVELELRVCVAPGYVRPDVEEAARDALSTGTRPDGGRGAFHPDNFTFGQTVYLAPLVAAVMRIPGVARAEPTVFRRWRESDSGELAAGRILLESLEIARLDDDPSRPEFGQLRFVMEGGA